jgi:drug/metabolite transporter superfamily protein YnfA
MYKDKWWIRLGWTRLPIVQYLSNHITADLFKKKTNCLHGGVAIVMSVVWMTRVGSLVCEKGREWDGGVGGGER